MVCVATWTTVWMGPICSIVRITGSCRGRAGVKGLIFQNSTSVAIVAIAGLTLIHPRVLHRQPPQIIYLYIFKIPYDLCYMYTFYSIQVRIIISIILIHIQYKFIRTQTFIFKHFLKFLTLSCSHQSFLSISFIVNLSYTY